MRKKRVIQLKNPTFQKIRSGLRRILLSAVKQQLMVLINKQTELLDVSEAKLLTNDEYFQLVRPIIVQRDNLETSLSNSIVICAICQKVEGDRIFSPRDKKWYCPKCFNILEKSYKKDFEAMTRLN